MFTIYQRLQHFIHPQSGSVWKWGISQIDILFWRKWWSFDNPLGLWDALLSDKSTWHEHPQVPACPSYFSVNRMSSGFWHSQMINCNWGYQGLARENSFNVWMLKDHQITFERLPFKNIKKHDHRREFCRNSSSGPVWTRTAHTHCGTPDTHLLMQTQIGWLVVLNFTIFYVVPSLLGIINIINPNATVPGFWYRSVAWSHQVFSHFAVSPWFLCGLLLKSGCLRKVQSAAEINHHLYIHSIYIYSFCCHLIITHGNWTHS